MIAVARIARRLFELTGNANRSRRPVSSAPICDSVLDWCASHPSSGLLRLRPAFTVSRCPARTNELTLHAKFQVPLAYTVPEKYLAVIPAARLLGPPGIVALPDGSFAA